MLYYVDTCIWLNFFKKEEPFWRYAEDFFDENHEILISKSVLKELVFKMNCESGIIKRMIHRISPVLFIKALPEDYNLARRIERENEYQIGFLDCMHIAISSRLQAILITRETL